jgi:Bacteriophage clamp loader A subunit
MSPFDLINGLMTSKADNWAEAESAYNPFITNRSASYHYDVIMLANEMTKLHCLPERLQYDFYRLAINPKKKRFAKWAKPVEDELIQLISKTYNVNTQRAIEIRSLLNTEAIGLLRDKTNTGGR